MHGNVKVNGQAVERFRTSYVNPFALHFNNQVATYMASSAPAELIKTGDKFLKLTLDLTDNDMGIQVLEVGSYDYM